MGGDKSNTFEGGSRDGEKFFGMHDTNLFDENESRAGERYDLATGEPFDNSRTTLGQLGLDQVIDPNNSTRSADGEKPHVLRSWSRRVPPRTPKN